MRILGLSSFIPEQICDVIKFSGYQGDKGISHYCNYVSDFISQVLNDDTIDGAVYPKSCDSCRIISSYLENTDKFTHQLHIPARQDEFAIEIFAESIKKYKESMENYFNCVISEDEINNRCQIIKNRNEIVQKYYNNIENIRYSKYLCLLHNLQRIALNEQMQYISNHRLEQIYNKGKRVFLIGSRVINIDLIKNIESAGMTVVGDNLTESKRFFAQEPREGIDNIYRRISSGILYNKLSPTQNNYSKILLQDMDEINKKNVQGVIFITQKYCEPYDYLFYVYKKMLDNINIPVLRLSLSGTSSIDSSKLSLEAFSEMI